MTTSFGAIAIVAASALLASLLGLTVTSPLAARAASLAGMIGAGVALALSGHASTAAPQIMMRPAVFVHAVSVAFWIGALLPLAVVLRDPQAVPALLRFSRVIPWTVAALLASGAVLAVVQVQQPAALATTAYGRILSAKVGLVLLLLALAAWNRFRATPAIRADVAGARRRLQRTILAELILVMCIFGLVASWRFTPPPRALAAAAAQPTQLHIHTAEAMADIRFEPGHAGIVRASIVIMTGDFGSLDAKEVQLSIANKAAGIEAISRPARRGRRRRLARRATPDPTRRSMGRAAGYSHRRLSQDHFRWTRGIARLLVRYSLCESNGAYFREGWRLAQWNCSASVRPALPSCRSSGSGAAL